MTSAMPTGWALPRIAIFLFAIFPTLKAEENMVSLASGDEAIEPAGDGQLLFSHKVDADGDCVKLSPTPNSRTVGLVSSVCILCDDTITDDDKIVSSVMLEPGAFTWTNGACKRVEIIDKGQLDNIPDHCIYTRFTCGCLNYADNDTQGKEDAVRAASLLGVEQSAVAIVAVATIYDGNDQAVHQNAIIILKDGKIHVYCSKCDSPYCCVRMCNGPKYVCNNPSTCPQELSAINNLKLNECEDIETCIDIIEADRTASPEALNCPSTKPVDTAPFKSEDQVYYCALLWGDTAYVCCRYDTEGPITNNCESFALSRKEKAPKFIDCLQTQTFKMLAMSLGENKVCVRKADLVIPTSLASTIGDPHQNMADGARANIQHYDKMTIMELSDGKDTLYAIEAMFKTWDTEAGSSQGTQTQAVGFCGSLFQSSVMFQMMDDGTFFMTYTIGGTLERKNVYTEIGNSMIMEDFVLSKTDDGNYPVVRIITDYFSFTMTAIRELALLQVTYFYPTSNNNIFGMSFGLMGTPNKILEDSFMLPNGEVIPLESTEEEINDIFGKSWISPGACLSGLRNFDEQAAQNFVPRYFDDIPVDPTIVQDCGGEESCVYDTWATNSTFYGQRTREYTEAYFQLKKEMSRDVPVIDGDTIWRVLIGQAFTTNLTVTDSLESMLEWSVDMDGSPENFIFDYGQLTWTPVDNSLRRISVVVFDTADTERISAPFVPFILFCDCNGNGGCNYNIIKPGTADIATSTFFEVGCDCDFGYDGHSCETEEDGCTITTVCLDSSSCIPLDPATWTAFGRQANCTACKSGYILEDNFCTDEDECTLSPTICDAEPNSFCVNNAGGYSCGCLVGYEKNEGVCTDIDECDLSGSTVVDCEQICVNSMGSFSCECHPGYTKIGNQCDPDPILDMFCNGQCNEDTTICSVDNSTGTEIASCVCKRGYVVQDASSCQDKKECDNLDDNNCKPGTVCIEEAPGYSCSCPGGQFLNSTRECEDCAEGTWGIDCVGICDCLTADTVCDPINGCEACSPGFQGGSCDERIPCTPAVTDCGTGSTCQENGDIFTCECDENYERNLTTFGCDAINQCETSPCENGGTCTQMATEFSCACRSGYTGDTCDINIDECVTKNVACLNGGTCVDKINNFECRCASGFRGQFCGERVPQRPTGPVLPSVFFFVEECFQNDPNPDAELRNSVSSYVRSQLQSDYSLTVGVKTTSITKKPSSLMYDLTLPAGTTVGPQDLVLSLAAGLDEDGNGRLYLVSTEGSRCEVNRCGILVAGASSIPDTAVALSPVWPAIVGALLAFLTVTLSMILLICCCPGFIGCCRTRGYVYIPRRIWSARPRGTRIPVGPTPESHLPRHWFPPGLAAAFRRRRAPPQKEQIYHTSSNLTGAAAGLGHFGPSRLAEFSSAGAALRRTIAMPGGPGPAPPPLPPRPRPSRASAPWGGLPRISFPNWSQRFSDFRSMFGRGVGASGGPVSPQKRPPPPPAAQGGRRMGLRSIFERNRQRPPQRGPSMPQNWLSRIFDMQRRGQVAQNIPMDTYGASPGAAGIYGRPISRGTRPLPPIPDTGGLYGRRPAMGPRPLPIPPPDLGGLYSAPPPGAGQGFFGRGGPAGIPRAPPRQSGFPGLGGLNGRPNGVRRLPSYGGGFGDMAPAPVYGQGIFGRAGPAGIPRAPPRQSGFPGLRAGFPRQPGRWEWN